MRKLVTVMAWVLLFTGCSPKQNSAGNTNQLPYKINIVTTIFPLYDFARAITGDEAGLTMLIKPGAETHSYDPSPADIIKIQNAHVFIYIGGENDQWVETILASMDTTGKKVIRLMDSVTPLEEEAVDGMASHEEHAETSPEDIEYDEHIWTSPQNAILMINAIQNILCETDAPNTKTYTENAAAYTEKIRLVEDEIRDVVALSQNKLLVFGDRFPFRYFTQEFGLTYCAAFSGCSTATETSAATLAYLIDMVNQNNIPYIYHVELSNAGVANVICEQTGAGLLLLHSCQNVTKDSFLAGDTYVSLMQQNAENLKKGLNE